MRLALALVMVLAAAARADGDSLDDDVVKREAVLRAERAAAARTAELAKRREAASQIKLGQARAKLAEADAHERADRTGSALRAILVARELAELVADPTGRGHFHPWDSSAPAPTTKAGIDAEELHRVATARMTPLVYIAPSVGIDLAGLTYPSEIVIEQDGVVVPTSAWTGAWLDPGDHVWTARMDNFVFYRLEERARPGRSVLVRPQFPFDSPPPPNVPAPLPRSQIAK